MAYKSGNVLTLSGGIYVIDTNDYVLGDIQSTTSLTNVTGPLNKPIKDLQGNIEYVLSGMVEFESDLALSGGSSLIGYLPSPGTVVSTAQAQLRKIVRISDFASNSLNTAVGAISTSPTTLYIDAVATCTGPLTIPDTLSIVCLREGSIAIASGTLTIYGSFEAGLWQVFSGAGAVSFGNRSVEKGYPEWWGATGDGTTNDTTALQKAFTAAGSGLHIELLEGNVYRITSAVSITSNTTLCGRGVILVDYTQSVYTGGIEARGTAGTSMLLTLDVDDLNDVGVTVASNTAFSIGDTVEIGQTVIAEYPIMMAKVSGLTSTTGISVESPIGMAYTVANGAYIKKITPIENITIRDITFDQDTGATSTYNFIYMDKVKNVLVENIKVLRQTGNTATVATIVNGLNVDIRNNKITPTTRPSTGSGEGIGGNAFDVENCTNIFICNNLIERYYFPIGVYRSIYGSIKGNIINTNYGDALRMIKVYGSSYINVIGNNTRGGETAVKMDGSNRCVISDNIFGCTESHTVNIDVGSASNNVVNSNLIFSSNSYGVYLGTVVDNNIVSNNTILNSLLAGIFSQGNSNNISNNIITGFGTAGIITAQLNIINGNRIYTSNDTIPCISTTGTFSPNNAAIINGNSAWNNPLDLSGSNPANFTACLFTNNNIKSLGGRVFYSSVAPNTGTGYVKGDKVLNNDTNWYGAYSGWIYLGSGSTWVGFGQIGMRADISANRPTKTTVGVNADADWAGYIYRDTTLAKPIWWTGSAWIDATGATV